MIENETRNIIKGKVMNLKSYGAFIKLDDDSIGLCHIKQVSDYFVKDLSAILPIGSTHEFEVLSSENGKTSLSYKSFRPEMLGKFTPEGTSKGFKNLKTKTDKEIGNW